MRVLFITQTQDMSGANRSLLQLILELRSSHGVEPLVVMPRYCVPSAHTMSSECSANGIPFLLHRMAHFKRQGPLSWGMRVSFVLKHTYSILFLLWRLRHQKFDLVHSNTSVTDLGAFVSRWKGVPHLWHLREFGKEDFGLVPCLGTGYEKWIYGKCERIVAISEAIRKAFLRVIDGSRITVVYNGILPQPESLDACHDSHITRIAMVGRIEPGKNQMEALQAIALLKERDAGVPLHLNFIGRIKDEDYHARMQQFIREHHLESCVSFMGVRNDVPRLLSQTDIGLMLSTSEAFGRVTVEFMMQNVAVIATDAGANAEIIRHGDSGLLYTLGHPEQLAECLNLLISNHELLLQTARNGKRHAMENFTSRTNSEKIFAIYNTLTAGK